MSDSITNASFSTLPEGTFSMYNLSEVEAVEGGILNNAQKKYFHNLRATYAEEKLSLAFDPEKVVQYAQQEARLLGMLEILNYILDNSEAVNYALNNPEANQ